MMLLNRYLSIEVFLVHIGHGLLFVAAVVLVLFNAPWWFWLIAVPIALLCLAGWLYEARFVLPAATRLWRGELVTPGRKPVGRRTTDEERND